MMRLPIGTPVYVLHDPIDFRKGVMGLSGVCQSILRRNPERDGAFVFRNRSSTAMRVLYFDSQGFCLFHKILAKGQFEHWPSGDSVVTELIALELDALIWNGDPLSMKLGTFWNGKN